MDEGGPRLGRPQLGQPRLGRPRLGQLRPGQPRLGRRASLGLSLAGLFLLPVGAWAYAVTASHDLNVELLAYIVLPALTVATTAADPARRRLPLALLLALIDVEALVLGVGPLAALPFAVVAPLLSVAAATSVLPPGRLLVPYVAAWLSSAGAVALQVRGSLAPGELLIVVSTFAVLDAIPLLLLWRLDDRQHNALAALTETEGRLRDLLEDVDLIAVDVDRTGKVAFMNRAGLRLTGWSAEEAIGADWFGDFATPERRAEGRERYRRLLAGEAEYDRRRESPILTRSGEARLIRWSHVTRHDARGGVAGLASLGEDVTAARVAEAEARRMSDTLAAVVDGSPLPIMFFDPDLTIRLWNGAAARLFGWTSEQVVGVRLPDLVRPEAREAAAGKMTAALCQGLSLDGLPLRIPTRDGKQLSLRMYGRPQFDATGVPAGFIAQVIDMTEHETMEERLREAQKMEAVGRLAGGVAHDFNNTLTAIGGFAELIAGATDDSEIREEAAAISDGVRRAANLTRQLLAYARRSHLQPEAVEVNDLVGGLRPMLHRLLREDIEIVIESRLGEAHVRVDPGQFEQALLNLALNARDAMPRGGRLTIATARRDTAPERARRPVMPDTQSADAGAPAAWISVSVSDTGSGIPQEIRSRVFDPFFTTKAVGAGTGLGLAMVEGFVAQSGGLVVLTSEVAVGTTLEILLPEVRAPRAAAPPAPAPLAAPGSGETILFVEDEPAVAAVGFQILTRRGYRVLLADSGATALAILDGHTAPIALLLADVILPDMRGTQVAEVAERLHPEAAILFASGYSADAFVSRGELAPAVDLIQKPYAPEQLALRVRAAIDRRRAVQEDASVGSPAG